jgi:hypothetical protein
MSGTVLFKFKNARGDPEAVQFEGYHISAVELKNLIAEKKGLVDGTLELSDPKTKAVFEDSHVFPRGSAVTVRRVAATRAAQRAQQQAATAADATEEAIAGPAMATLQAMTAQSGAAAVDPQDENATLQQRKAGQGAEDLQIAALVDAQNEAWRAQTDKNILATRAREQQLAAQRGRGRGFGSAFMHSGRGRGQGGTGIGFCKFCGKLDDHFSDDCPQKYNPRTDLRHVRAPAGIPAELLETSTEGGLLLNTGKTGALKSSTAAAAKEFAALPTAVRRAPAALALTNAPHEEQQQQLLLGNGGQQQEPDEEEQGLQQLAEDDDEDQQQQLTPSREAAAEDAGDEAAADADADLEAMDAAFDDDEFAFDRPADDAAPGLFDDEDDDLAPPAGTPAGAAAAAGDGKLHLGIGMELDEPPAAATAIDSEQARQDSLQLQQQQQQRSPMPQPHSPLAQQLSPQQHRQVSQPPAGRELCMFGQAVAHWLGRAACWRVNFVMLSKEGVLGACSAHRV